jgi:hypothetical protein
MLLKLLDHIKSTDVLGKRYVGIVVSNSDPRRLGRVKCTVAGLWESEDADTLPWIFPQNPAGQGGRGDTGALDCPEVGSQLVIEFPFGDVYSPFYTGFWQSDETHQGELDEDYPNTRGWQDGDGSYFKLNTAKRRAEFKHAGGGHARFLADGTVEIISPKAVRILSADGKSVLAIDAVEGNTEISNRGNSTLNGGRTVITSKQHVVDVGSVADKATGSREVETGGGYKHIIGGGLSEAVVANVARSVGGDVDETIAGAEKHLIGMGRETTIATGGDIETIVEGDLSYTLTLGNFKIDIVAGDVEIKTAAGSVKVANAIGSFDIGATGDIALKNAVAQLTASAAGDIALKNAVAQLNATAAGDVLLKNAVGSIHIDPTGKFGIGTPAAELIDQVIQTIDAILPANQPNLCMTGVGPSGPLLPPAVVTLTAIKTLLTSIKGSV